MQKSITEYIVAKFEGKSIKTLEHFNGIVAIGCSDGTLLIIRNLTIDRVLHLEHCITKVKIIQSIIIILDEKGVITLVEINNSASKELRGVEYAGKILDFDCYEYSLVACTENGFLLTWDIRLSSLATQLSTDFKNQPTVFNLGSDLRLNCIRINSNGKFYACGSKNGEILLYNTISSSIAFFPKLHNGWVRSIGFSNDSSELVSGGSDGKLILWNTDCLCKKKETCGSPNMTLCHAFLKESNTCIVSGNDCKITLWNLDSLRKEHELIGHIDWVRCLSVCNTCDSFISGGSDGRIVFWSIIDNNFRCAENKILYSGKSWIMSLHWSPDDSYFASGHRSGNIRLWKRGKLGDFDYIDLTYHNAPVHCVRFCPNAPILASCDESGNIVLWNYSNSTIINQKKIADRPIRQIRWSQYGDFLVACSLNDRIFWFTFQKDKYLLELLHAYVAESVRCIEFIDDKLYYGGINHNLMYQCCGDGSIHFYDEMHLDIIDYVSSNSSFISTSGHDGLLILREKSTSKTTVLQALPGVNILGCKFIDCNYSDEFISNILFINGGDFSNDRGR